MTDEANGPEQRRDQNNGARGDREDSNDCCRQRAKSNQWDRSFIRALLFGDDQRPEKHEAANQGAYGEQDYAQVEAGLRFQWYV